MSRLQSKLCSRSLVLMAGHRTSARRCIWLCKISGFAVVSTLNVDY